MELGIIAAVSDNGAIGINGRLPFYVPDDLKHFKQLTLGKSVIMGRATYQSIIESLGNPLPGRRNIVISNSLKTKDVPEGVILRSSLEGAISLCHDESEAWIIGGEKLYGYALMFADKMEITHVHTQCGGDRFFPKIDERIWRESSRTNGKSNGFSYDFVSYIRKS